MHLDHLPGSFFGPSNLVDLLRHRAAHQSNDPAFHYLVDGETDEILWTYAELDRRARAIAGAEAVSVDIAQRVGPGVGADQAQTVSGPLLHLNLQRVIIGIADRAVIGHGAKRR